MVWLGRCHLAFAVANCVLNLRFAAALLDAAPMGCWGGPQYDGKWSFYVNCYFFRTTPTNRDLREKAVYFPAWPGCHRRFLRRYRRSLRRYRRSLRRYHRSLRQSVARAVAYAAMPVIERLTKHRKTLLNIVKHHETLVKHCDTS